MFRVPNCPPKGLPLLGACAMTTKFLDNKKFAFSKFYFCRGVSHQKKSVLDDFPLCRQGPPPPPPQKRIFYFYCRLAVSDLQCYPGRKKKKKTTIFDIPGPQERNEGTFAQNHPFTKPPFLFPLDPRCMGFCPAVWPLSSRLPFIGCTLTGV